MSQSPPRSAARDVASAAVEIDFTGICPLGPRQRRGPVSPLGPSRRPPVTERSGAPGPAPSSAGHEVPAMVAVVTAPVAPPRSLLIATYAGATMVVPPGRAARERGRPALCANVLDEFVRALLPQLDLTSGGPARGLHAPPGPNGLLRGRHVPPALIDTPTSSSYPACRFLLSPSAHKEFAVESDHVGLPTKEFQFAVLENDTILPHTPQGPGEMFRGRGMVPARPGPSSCTSRRAAPSRRRGRRSTTGGGPRGSRSPRRPCRAGRGSSSRGRRRPRRRC